MQKDSIHAASRPTTNHRTYFYTVSSEIFSCWLTESPAIICPVGRGDRAQAWEARQRTEQPSGFADSFYSTKINLGQAYIAVIHALQRLFVERPIPELHQ